MKQNSKDIPGFVYAPFRMDEQAELVGNYDKSKLSKYIIKEEPVQMDMDFDYNKWIDRQDESNKRWLQENLVKGCTGEHLSDEEIEFFYNDFVKEKIIYHRPEDSETLKNIIDTYNYLNKWK